MADRSQSAESPPLEVDPEAPEGVPCPKPREHSSLDEGKSTEVEGEPYAIPDEQALEEDEELRKLIEAKQSIISKYEIESQTKSETIQSLKKELDSQKETIETLKEQASKDQETIAKQKITITTQSATIAKNPAPWKNRERYIENLIQRHSNQQTPSNPSGEADSTERRPTKVSSQELQQSQGTLPHEASIVDKSAPRGPAAVKVPTYSQVVAIPNIRDSSPLQPQVPPNIESGPSHEGSLQVVPRGGFHVSQGDSNTLMPTALGHTQREADTQVHATLAPRPALVPPPGLPVNAQTSTMANLGFHARPSGNEDSRQIPLVDSEMTKQWEVPLPSATVSLCDLSLIFGNLFGLVKQWTMDYASAHEDIVVPDRVSSLLQRFGISEQHIGVLLSVAGTKPLLTARLLNEYILDVFMRPKFLQSIDRQFDEQVGRTYAQVQGRGPGSPRLRENVMNNIAALFQSLPCRGDWGTWVSSQLRAKTAEMYDLVYPLLDQALVSQPEVQQQATGRLTGIVGEAIEASLTMFSQPFLYKFPFPAVWSIYNPLHMVECDGTDSTHTQDMRVFLAVSPIISVHFWHTGDLQERVIRCSEVL